MDHSKLDEKSALDQSLAIEYDLGELEKMDPALSRLTSERVSTHLR